MTFWGIDSDSCRPLSEFKEFVPRTVQPERLRRFQADRTMLTRIGHLALIEKAT